MFYGSTDGKEEEIQVVCIEWMIRAREYELADWGWIVEEMGLCIKIENYTSAVAQHSWAKKESETRVGK